MVFCSYKRRSLWKGHYFGTKVYGLMFDYEQGEEVLVFERASAFFPCFVSRTYAFYTGESLVRGAIVRKRVYMKVGQTSLTKRIGSKIHGTVVVRKGKDKQQTMKRHGNRKGKSKSKVKGKFMGQGKVKIKGKIIITGKGKGKRKPKKR